MNSSIRRVLSFSILVLTCFAFSSCNKDDKATTITVSPEKVTVNVGETVKVLAIIEPETQGPATWKSLNESIATVSDGVITGVSKGETQVEAITKDGSKATVMVTVNEAPVGDLSISPNPLRVNEGEDLKVSVNGLPVGVQADFKVANSSVASVSKDGILHGVEEGATELTVSAKGKTASVKVLVSSKDLISFVDPVFKECVVKGLPTEDGAVLGCIDYNGDGEISKKEAGRLTGKENSLALFDIIEIEDGVEKSRRSLQSTEDLKWFPNAMALMVRGCKTLKKIDFDKLPKLTNIMLSDLPAVSKLDLTTIPHLDGAYISWVESSSLDFSSCRELTGLIIEDVINAPKIKSINLSGCSKLQVLHVYGAKNLSDNGISWPSEMPRIEDITFDESRVLIQPILNKYKNIQKFSATNVDPEENGQYVNNGVINIDGMTKLTDLFIGGNRGITGINITKTPKLINFFARDCNIKAIDLSNQSALNHVEVNGNKLISLRLDNGNTSAIKHLSAYDNSELKCIKVSEDLTLPLNKDVYDEWYLDETTQLSYNCDGQTEKVNHNRRAMKILKRVRK